MFPPNKAAVLAGFLIELASSTPRPRAQITNATAAIACMSEKNNRPNLMLSPPLQRRIQALIKSQTLLPRVHTPVMPIEPFMTLFNAWPDNWKLELHNLRIKTLALLALTVMLRPSDVAPNAEHFDIDAGIASKITMSTKQVKFKDDGSLTLWLQGIKNDRDRDGFQVNIPQASEPKIDPVKALQVYMLRTDHIRPASGALFLTLRRPHTNIGSATVAKDLELAIKYAGLQGQGYSAKSFRPTGATTAIQNGCQPDQVRAIIV